MASADSSAPSAPQELRQHRRAEQMIAHEQREPRSEQALARGQHRHTVFEMPLGVVAELNLQPVRCVAVDHASQAVGLITQHEHGASNPGIARRLEGSQDQRLSKNRFEEFRATPPGLETVAVAGGKHQRGADGHVGNVRHRSRRRDAHQRGIHRSTILHAWGPWSKVDAKGVAHGRVFVSRAGSVISRRTSADRSGYGDPAALRLSAHTAWE